MKKTQLVLGLLVALTSLTTVANAQMKEGKISYERKINMHRNLPDPQMKSMVPEFRTDKFELIFNEKEYLISKKMLQMRIRANIAQDLWTSSESYQIYNDFNEALQKALEVYKLKKYNTFNLDQ